MRILTARWVLPVSAPPVEDGCVAITDDGEIAYVGDRNGAPRGEEDTLGNVVLTPGLVNAHSHVDLTALRGSVPAHGFFDWIRTLVDLKSRYLDPDSLLASANVGLAEGLRAGITSFGDTADNESAMHAMLHMGVRGISYQEVFGPAPEHCHDAMVAVRARIERLRANETSRVLVGISPHAPYTVCDELYRSVAAYAEAARLPIATHIAESEAESDLVTSGTGPFSDFLQGRGIPVPAQRASSPMDLLHSCGIMSMRPALVHAIRVNPDDIDQIASCGAGVVHCPAANASLGHAVAPVVALLAAGVTVALGSDSVISNDRMDLLEEARLAYLLQSEQEDRERLLDPAALLRMLTLEGARVLGIEDQVGTLEPGKRADISAFSLEGLHAAPGHDPVRTLVFSLRGSDASFVMVDGQILVQQGRLLRDMSAELSVVERVAHEIRVRETTATRG